MAAQETDAKAQTALDEGRATDIHVGQRLRQRRWMLGLTQQQVGDRVGIKFQQVQKYETGQNRVSASRLWDLAKALDVAVGYFYDGLGGAPAEDAAQHPASQDGGAGDPMADRESIELVRAYYAIPDEPRRRLYDLAKAMADAAAGAGAEGAERSFNTAADEDGEKPAPTLRLQAS